jgi:septum formation protein
LRLDNLITVRLTLVYSSPRRRELLQKLGIPFDIRPSHASERWIATECTALATLNASRKVEGSSLFGDGTRLLLGADTIVVLGSRPFGKPAGIESARRMLVALSGNTHLVITGISLAGPAPAPIPTRPIIRVEASAQTHVRFRPLTDSDIGAYLETGEWLGKAGAYAIQESGSDLVSNIDGDFDNVVGLPVTLLNDLLSKHFSHCRFL